MAPRSRRLVFGLALLVNLVAWIFILRAVTLVLVGD